MRIRIQSIISDADGEDLEEFIRNLKIGLTGSPETDVKPLDDLRKGAKFATFNCANPNKPVQVSHFITVERDPT